jgi:hypothetical protein
MLEVGVHQPLNSAVSARVGRNFHIKAGLDTSNRPSGGFAADPLAIGRQGFGLGGPSRVQPEQAELPSTEGAPMSQEPGK